MYLNLFHILKLGQGVSYNVKLKKNNNFNQFLFNSHCPEIVLVSLLSSRRIVRWPSSHLVLKPVLPQFENYYWEDGP